MAVSLEEEHAAWIRKVQGDEDEPGLVTPLRQKLVQHSSDSVQWYTPIDVIERARRVLGGIDLDPASDEFGNSRVKATQYYSANGLELPWRGKVFVNPPGGRGSAKRWFQKFMTCEEGIFIGFSIELLQACQEAVYYPFCIPARRLRYEKPDSKPTSPPHASVIIYKQPLTSANSQAYEFEQEFASLGAVVLHHCC